MHNVGSSGSFEKVVDVLRDMRDVWSSCHGPMGWIGLSRRHLAAALVVPIDDQFRICGEAFRARQGHRIVSGPQSGLGFAEGRDARFGAETGSRKGDGMH